MEQSIKELLLKIKELTERGATEGERIAAARLLNRKLLKLGLNLEDVQDREERTREFKVIGKEEQQIIINILCDVLLANSVKCAIEGKKFFVRLTDAEYRESAALINTYIPQFRKELKKNKTLLKVAFIQKHELGRRMSNISNDVPEGCVKTLSDQEMLQIRRLMNGLDSVQRPSKQIEYAG